jgi:hypothetical protein
MPDEGGGSMAQGAGHGQELLGCALLVALFLVGVAACTHVLVTSHDATLQYESELGERAIVICTHVLNRHYLLQPSELSCDLSRMDLHFLTRS